MKQVTISIYEFSELLESAKQTAINEHREFMLSTMSPSDFISGDDEHDTEAELIKVYNSEYNHVSVNDEPVIESIEANEYLFYSDGKLTNCVTYCGNHPKSGITELTIGHDVYEITR